MNMANLRGTLNYGHHAGSVSKLAHENISAELATWEGRISASLNKDGSYSVAVNGTTIKKGNVNKKV